MNTFDAVEDLIGRLARRAVDGSLSADEEAAALAVIVELIAAVHKLLKMVGE